jgi:hypothetical protein
VLAAEHCGLMTAVEPIRFRVLAAYYRQQADVCFRMAQEALSPYDEEWLRLAACWAELEREAKAKWRPN